MGWLTAAFVGCTLVPGAVLGWVGLRATTADADRLQAALREECARQLDSLVAGVPEMLEERRARLAEELRPAVAALRDTLPTLAPGLALRAARARVPPWLRAQTRVSVSGADGTALWPAMGPTRDATRHLPEWAHARAILAHADRLGREAGPAQAAELLEGEAEAVRADSLRGRILARAATFWELADRPGRRASCAARIAWLEPRDLAASGPHAVRVVAESEHGPRSLAGLWMSGWLAAVPAPAPVRLEWQRVATAYAGDSEPTVIGAHTTIRLPLAAGTTAQFDIGLDALLDAWLPATSGECSVQWSPADGASAGAKEVDAAEGPVVCLGETRIATVRHPTSTIVVREGRRRVLLTSMGIAALLSVMGLGLWLVRRALAREGRARRLRDDFIANVSHELKTPLTALQLHAEMLAEEDLDAATRERYGRVALAEGARLGALVEDLLDFSALERGRRRLDPTPTDLGAAAESIAAAWRPMAARDGVELSVRRVQPLSSALIDGIALSRIVANLVQNAWKHGVPARDGGPRRIRLVAGPGTSLEVRDNGPGVPVAERSIVFERFGRGADSSARAGAGIGLSLARELARASGGDLVHDDDGNWTIFRLTTPPVPEQTNGAIP